MAEKRFIELLNIPDTYLWAAHSLDSTRIAGLLREEKDAMLNRLQHSIDTMDDEKFRQTFRRNGSHIFNSFIRASLHDV